MDSTPITDNRQRRRFMWVSFDTSIVPDTVASEFETLEGFKYVIFQLEKCPTTLRLHYQGYLTFHFPKRASTINNALSFNCSLRIARGTVQQCVKYVTKDQTRQEGPWQRGERPTPGQRNDLAAIANVAITSTSLRDVIMFDPVTFMRYSRGLQTILNYTLPKRTTPPVVYLFYGPPGTGKTRYIHDNFQSEDIYVKQTDDSYFDGYFAQDVFALDDFAGRASKMSLKYFLILTDRYDVLMPIKYGHANLLATKIFVTTNVHPSLWYDYGDRQGEWLCVDRRFHSVIWFRKDKPPTPLVKESFFTNEWYRGCDEESLFRPLFRDVPGNQEQQDMRDLLDVSDVIEQ